MKIVLVGYRAAGKSTLGRLLSDAAQICPSSTLIAALSSALATRL